MMNIFEFMKAIRIEGTDAQVIMLNNAPEKVVVNWLFEVPDHPTLTHKRVSRIIQEHMLGHLHLLVDDVKHIIEVPRNAQ